MGKIVISKITFFLLTQLFLMRSCHEEEIEGKLRWEDHREVCGREIHYLSESIKAEIKNQINTEDGEPNKRKDIIVVSYENFSCCLKKTWVEEIMLHSDDTRCMEVLLKCMVEYQKKRCTLSFADHFIFTFSNYAVGVLMLFTLIIVVLSCFVCCQLDKYYIES